MTTLSFKQATRQRLKLRMALIGPSGSGKSYTALTLAKHLGSKIAVIDSEGHSASKYADPGDGTGFKFDVLELDTFAPQTYTAAINAAAESGYDVLIIDSLSHAWMGKEGALEQVSNASTRDKNNYTAWRHVTPHHNALVDAMLRCPMHLIVTMRSKTEYVIEEQERNGRKVSVPRKVGMAPIQRDGLEYEFDLCGELDQDNTLVIGKTRCSALASAVIQKPGKDLAKTLKEWLNTGKAVESPTPAPPATKPEPKPAAPKPTPAAQEAPAAPTDSTKLSDANRSAFARNIAALRDKDGSLYEKACTELGYKDEDFATVETTGEAKDMWSKMVAKVNELRGAAV